MKEHNNREKANQFAEYITGSELIELLDKYQSLKMAIGNI